MPITKSAKKALRVSARKRIVNLVYIEKYKDAVREVRKAIAEGKAEVAEKALLGAFAALDRAAKVSVIHKNKAANLKSNLHKALNKIAGKAVLLKSTKTKSAPTKVAKKPTKKK